MSKQDPQESFGRSQLTSLILYRTESAIGYTTTPSLIREGIPIDTKRSYTQLMDTFISWFTPKNVVTFLSAAVPSVLALAGVFYSNWKADKRRDIDQAKTEEWREIDNKTREKERFEQIEIEDYARQRRAVSDCIRKMRKAKTEAEERPVSPNKYMTLFNRYEEYIQELDLEITQHEMRKCVEKWKANISDAREKYQTYVVNTAGRGGFPPMVIASVKDSCPNELLLSAKENLHPVNNDAFQERDH